MDHPECGYLLHADFAAQARRTPEAVALYDGTRQVTYARLQARARHLAGALHEAGIGRGACVGLHLDRSIDYYAVALALLHLGAAVVPLPPSYPRTRIAQILAHAQLDAVVDRRDTPLTGADGTVVLHVADLDARAVDAVPEAVTDPDLPAFVLASSGSTGTPKLIVRSHRSFYHRLCWTWTQHPYEPGERCVQKSAMTTTHSLYELFEPLLRGVPVWILSDAAARDLPAFWDTINALSITRLLVVPSALQAALDLPGFAAPTLRVLVLMGEYVHHRLVARALAALPAQTYVCSIYGSTEASSTLLCDLREAYRPDQELPLGHPLVADVQAYVLDERGQPVADGESGVLYLGGTALFSGYFRDPAATASVLVSTAVSPARLYHTHDQVRLGADGQLYFLGRTDHTVKVRGFRVDLQEVERTLLQHVEIRHAAVVLHEGDHETGPTLLGFYAPATVARTSVQQFLAQHLPAYMAPSQLVGLESLPRTASGKTDRRQLLQQHRERLERSTQSAVATDERQGDTVRRVGAIWGQLLKQGPLDADTRFFDAGGTSLTAFAAVHRLREAFGLDRTQLPDPAIFRSPSVREMAAEIERALGGRSADRGEAGSEILFRMRAPADETLPPVFLIASAGGTLGAYEKLARALRTPREVIGVRDPYVWGGREATLGFRAWIDLYVDAIRRRQPAGPYHVVAYSSAGAFGYEIARRLRQAGETVALLALIDPLSLDRGSPTGFGFRAMQTRWGRPWHRWAIRLEGWWRARAASSAPVAAGDDAPVELALTDAEFQARVQRARTTIGEVRSFATLLELGSGIAFSFPEAEVAALTPERCFPAFLARVQQVAPELDTHTVERIFDQYVALQLPAHQAYPLHRYDGAALLVEPKGQGCGLIAAQLRPHMPRLRALGIAMGPPSAQVDALARGLSQRLREHYLCMRDDTFVAALAAELDRALAAPGG